MPPEFWGQLASLEMLDMLACALLAAGASWRARVLGAQAMGAVVLGIFCGLCAPMTREALLHGPAGARLVFLAMPDVALLGSVGGLCGLMLSTGIRYRAFLCLDGAGLGLAGCVGAALGLGELGIVGALVLGLLCGLLPGLLRDMALGDTAKLVEENWYAAACALGAMLTIIALLCLPAMSGQPLWGVLAGALLAVLLRFFRGSPE